MAATKIQAVIEDSDGAGPWDIVVEVAGSLPYTAGTYTAPGVVLTPGPELPAGGTAVVRLVQVHTQLTIARAVLSTDPPPPPPSFTSYIALSCFDGQVRPNFWINYQVSASDPLGIYTVRDANGTLLNLGPIGSNPYQHGNQDFGDAFDTASYSLHAINAFVLDYPGPWRLEYQETASAPVIVVSTSDVPLCAPAPPGLGG